MEKNKNQHVNKIQRLALYVHLLRIVYVDSSTEEGTARVHVSLSILCADDEMLLQQHHKTITHFILSFTHI